MYGIEKKFNGKTFLDKGYSQLAISRELRINCKTVIRLAIWLIKE